MSRNPYDYLLPVTSDKKFVGRNEIAEKICDEIAYIGGSSFAVIGGRRFGKTSLLNVIKLSLGKRKRTKKATSVLPIAIDFTQNFSSADAFYAFAAKKIEQYILSWLPDLKPHIATLDKGAGSLPYLSFVESLEGVLSVLKIYSHTRVVFLLDEIDVTLDYPWHLSFFDQLRALISSSSVKDHTSLVMFGAHYIYETKRQGSPLLNLVKPIHLQCVDRSAVDALVALGQACSTECADEVWRLSGGHPHLVQYLLHYLWDERDGFKSRNSLDVSRIAAQYYRDHPNNLLNWTTALGADGCRVYDALCEVHDWMDEADIAKKVGLPISETKVALDRLCFQGLAIINGNTYIHYRPQGDLFQNWFSRNKQAFLAQDKKKNPTGSASINIQGENFEVVFGDQQKVNANKIRGDVLGSSTGLSAADIESIFKDIYSKIRDIDNASPVERSEINQTVKEIETAVASGSKDEVFFETRLRNLKHMAPDILDVVLTTVGNPLLGIKLMAEKIANKLKAESDA